MLADYVLRSIDNLFTDKLSSNEGRKLFAKPKPSPFNKQTIQKELPNAIRRQAGQEALASPRRSNSPSPLTKSRLKTILEHNKKERIKSVVRRTRLDEPSPYRKIAVEGSPRDSRLEDKQTDASCGKEDNLIEYYRQQRKTI